MAGTTSGCSIPECVWPIRYPSKGLCHNHYQQGFVAPKRSRAKQAAKTAARRARLKAEDPELFERTVWSDHLYHLHRMRAALRYLEGR
jgi:hypothetical protein